MIIVSGLLVLSALMGIYAFHTYRDADAYLANVLRSFTRQGKQLSVDGCVDAILDWRPTCRASRVLCDNFAGRLMRACLEARDRAGYCRSLPRRRGSTHFGYADCKKRGVTRRTRKACASAFRMIDVHCRTRHGR